MSKVLTGELIPKKPIVSRTPVHNKKSVYDLYSTLGISGRYWRTRCFCPDLRRQAAAYLHTPDGAVYDLCCGNGENFPHLYAAVGPRGRIYASDIFKAWEEIPKELGCGGILKRRMCDTHFIYCATK